MGRNQEGSTRLGAGLTAGAANGDVSPPAAGSERPIRQHRSPLKRLLSGSATYGLGRMLQNGAGILLVPIYTRYLSPSDYGIVAVTTAVASAFAVLLGMGLQGAVTRQYYDYREDERELREYVGTVFLFFMVVGVAVVGSMVLFGGGLVEQLIKGIPFSPYIELTLWTAFFTASSAHLLSIYRAREQASSYVSLTVLQTVLSLGGALYFVVVLGRGALGKIQGGMLGGAIVFGIVLVLMTREASFSFSRNKLSRALAFSLPLVPHLVFGWMLGVADRIYLERMTSLREVGLYTLGYQVGMLVSLIVSAINSAWVPIFYDTAKSDPNAPAVISRICTLYTAGVTLCALLLILAAPDLIGLMAEESYHGATQVVPLIALAYVFQGLYFMSVSSLFYMKRTRLLPALTGLSAVANVAINVTLVPRIGMMGAAWATLVSFVVLFLGTNLMAQKTYYIPYNYRKLSVPVLLLSGVVLLSGTINGLPWLAGAAARFAIVIGFVSVLVASGVVDHRQLVRLVPERLRTGLLL